MTIFQIRSWVISLERMRSFDFNTGTLFVWLLTYLSLFARPQAGCSTNHKQSASSSGIVCGGIVLSAPTGDLLLLTNERPEHHIR